MRLYRVFIIFFIIIACGSLFPDVGTCKTFESNFIPWSGYWWPKYLGELVNSSGNDRAPLEKYDFVTSGTYNGPAMQNGTRRYFDNGAPNWTGLCFNWACSAIREPEPVHKGSYGGLVFTVADKKGLLASAYSQAVYEKFNLTPELFHDTLERFIKDRGEPVILDLGGDGEIWTYPVFKYDMEFTQVGNSRTYDVTIYFADDFVQPGYVGTKVLSRSYRYLFELDGDIITDSTWLLGAGEDPPITAYEVYGPIMNNEVVHYPTARAIAATDDDPYEENDDMDNAGPIYSGITDLLAIDKDLFKLPLKSGDRLTIDLSSDYDGLSWSIFSSDGQSLLEGGTGVKSTFDCVTEGDYFLQVEAVDYSLEPEYRIALQHDLQYQAFFLKLAGRWQTNVAIFDQEAIPGRIRLTFFDIDGNPLLGSEAKADSKSWQYGGISDFGISTNEKGVLRMDSDHQLFGLQMFNDSSHFLMGDNFFKSSDLTATLPFPLVAQSDGWRTFYGLINTGSNEETVFRQAFAADGTKTALDYISLAPGAMVEYEAANMGILNNDASCWTAFTESGSNTLAGFMKFYNPAGTAPGKSLISVTPGSSDLYLPHVAADDNWWTGVVLMNLGEEATDLQAVAFNAAGEQTGEASFPLQPKQNFVRLARHIFPEAAPEIIASIKFTSSSGAPISGFFLYASSTAIRLAGTSLRTSKSGPLYLPYVGPGDESYAGIMIMNTGSGINNLRFELFDQDGNLLRQKELSLSENERLAILLQDLFDEENLLDSVSYMKIESLNDQKMAGQYLLGTWDGESLIGGGF